MALRLAKTFFSGHSNQLSRVLACKTYSTQYYPIDENIFGLTEDQQQLRETVFNFCQKELAPFAQEIDQNNGWK